MFTRGLLAVCAAAIILLLAGCSSGSDIPFVDTYVVEPTGSTIVAANGYMKLIFPANAVAQRTLITVTPGSATGTGLVTGTSIAVTPTNGEVLAQPVQLGINYLPTAATGLVPASLHLARLEEVGGVATWVAVADSVLDPVNHTVTGSMTAFGTYGIAGTPL